MRVVLLATLLALLVTAFGGVGSTAAQGTKDAKPAVKDTPAAELTRTKLLKVKVTVEFTDAPLGEVLKEFAAQVDMNAETPLMWAYGANFPHAKKVTIALNKKPLDEALDALLTKAGGGLGYVVVSRPGDKYDGWVRVTTTGERGVGPPIPTEEDEKTASERLAVAKRLIDAGKAASAKPLLEIIARTYPRTKAGAEAKELLGKMEK